MILFFCIVLPLLPAFVFMGGKTRKTVLFMLIGLFVCLFASFVNGFIQNISGMTRYEMTYLVTPMTEELLKIIPLIIYVYLFRPERHDIITAAVMVGIGFAILENAYICTSGLKNVVFYFAMIRGMGAGLMHGMCTLIAGFGMTYFHLRRKLAIVGTYALLIFSAVYHACYNLLIQSDYSQFGLLLPVTTIAVLLGVLYFNRRQIKRQKNKTQ